MEKPVYQIETSEDALIYEFESIHNNRIIRKRVMYLPDDEHPDLFQLIFGDILPDGKIDVFAVSNNDDMNIVISTVVSTLGRFFDQYPTKMVSFTGSTQSRTRLYRAVISKMMKQAELYYQVLGITTDGDFIHFDEQKTYDGYLIIKRT